MLAYEAIWSTFLDNFKVNDEDLPEDDVRIYNDIKNAVRRVNNRLRLKLVSDDGAESVTGDISNFEADDILFLIAHYIRLIYLINEKTLYESLYQPISQDVGIKNYRTQMNSLEQSIKRQQQDIESFIFNMKEEFV